jgi:hypothetical protein
MKQTFSAFFFFSFVTCDKMVTRKDVLSLPGAWALVRCEDCRVHPIFWQNERGDRFACDGDPWTIYASSCTACENETSSAADLATDLVTDKERTTLKTLNHDRA